MKKHKMFLNYFKTWLEEKGTPSMMLPAESTKMQDINEEIVIKEENLHANFIEKKKRDALLEMIKTEEKEPKIVKPSKTPFIGILVCSMVGCNNRSRKKSTRQKNIEMKKMITFHTFPRNIERRKAWIKAIGRVGWNPAKGSVLCSEHFTEANFDRKALNIRLKDSAVPTIIHPVYLEDPEINQPSLPVVNQAFPNETIAHRQQRLEKRKKYYYARQLRRIQYQQNYRAYLLQNETDQQLEQTLDVKSARKIIRLITPSKKDIAKNVKNVINRPINIKVNPSLVAISNMNVDKPIQQVFNTSSPTENWMETTEYTVDGNGNDKTIYKNVVIYLPSEPCTPIKINSKPNENSTSETTDEILKNIKTEVSCHL